MPDPSPESAEGAGPHPPEAPKGYDPGEVEARWYRVWEKAGYFRADEASAKPAFSMAIPPPNITGSLHMGHALSYTLEDVVTRFQRMRGKNTLWLPGTDHAGIATQLVVERELKKEGLDRRAMGREAFVARVWEWKAQCGGRITEQLRVLGCSVDWDRERFTLDLGLSRAVRHVFVQLYEEGLLHRAQRLINWCPRCLTALSDLEVLHEERPGKLWRIAYAVEGSPERLAVATTRPETLLGDTAVAIHPEDPRFTALHGKRAIVPLVLRSVPIVLDPILVSREFGTGAVKVTPAHDFNDFETGVRHGLARISLFDAEGRTTAAAGPYAGLDRFVARERVVADLDAQGALLGVDDHTIAVATCQRCGTILEPSLSWQWFVKMESLAKPALEAVEQGKVRLYPEGWTATYFHWMKNLRDWCVSRQLWWGHQIPAWYCGCGHITVALEDPTACAACGREAPTRDPDVLDTWFSSALWPFSTLGWPEKTQALATFYPTTLLETGSDILFFWVARMIMMGLKCTGEVPFREVYLHAMVRDERGDKMSKTKGNVVDPLDVTREHGADALRFTLASQSGQGRELKLSPGRVVGYRAFCNKVYNASRFVAMNLADFPTGAQAEAAPAKGLPERWIRSRLAVTAGEVAAALEAYRFPDATSAVYRFIWHELCDWYLELSKVALTGGDPEARLDAQRTLAFVLDGALRLLHPFMPFLTEELWQRLPRVPGGAPSIMIAAFPTAEGVDEPAEAAMGLVIRAIEALRNLRGENGLSPAKRIAAQLASKDPAVRQALEANGPIICALARLSELTVTVPGERLPRAAVAATPEFEVVVPLTGLIDFAEETRRLRKELGKAEADRAGLMRKLDTPSFVARAPAAILEKDRARVAELEGKLLQLARQLAVLEEPSP